jgi:hypothetical protein
VDRGWWIHRIWSTDWFHRPDEQLRKLVGAIAAAQARRDGEARSEPVDADEEPQGIPEPLDDDEIDRAEPADGGADGAAPAWVLPYQEARFEVPSETAIPDTPLPILTKIVTRIVTIEGPIHREEVIRRVTSLWGQQRAGNRITQAVGDAIERAIQRGDLQADGEFVSLSPPAEIPVRCRAGVAAAHLRKPELLPPAEIAAAIRGLLTDHIGLHRQEIPGMVARLLGFKAASAKLKDAIDPVVEKLIEQGQASTRDAKVFPPRKA